MMFKGVNNFLLRRIQAQLPVGFQFMRDQVEIITRPKVNFYLYTTLLLQCMYLGIGATISSINAQLQPMQPLFYRNSSCLGYHSP